MGSDRAASSARGATRRGATRLPVRLLSLVALVLGWQLLTLARGDPEVLPGPVVVAEAAAAEIASGRLQGHLAATLGRVLAAFGVAMAVGTALGIAMGLDRRLDRWLDPWLVVMLNIPALVVIVLCYLWIGLNEIAAVAAVALNKIPTVAAILREGARALDPALDDMARSFRMPPAARLRHVILPQLAPFLVSATRTGISLIWKIVLVVEFLGRGSGVGFMIQMHFQLFDVTTVLVYALSFSAVMLALEAAVLRPAERHVSRWRRR